MASKNDEKFALAVLEKFGLRPYFLCPQVNWGPKSESVRIIREELGIGYDAMAFVDDQPFERDEVAFVHPQVRCFDVDFIGSMLRHEALNPLVVTAEAANRRLMYLSDKQRKHDEETLADNQKFLASLDLKLAITPATPDDLKRIEELTIRTNQLNSTGYTYSGEELEELLLSPHHQVYVAELEDKYGTYGKIGVAMLECRGEEWRIKLFLVSCRVISRGTGTAMLTYLIRLAAASGKQLYAEFLPTDRNRIMHITYRFAGFREAAPLEGGGQLLRYDSPTEAVFPAYVTLRT